MFLLDNIYSVAKVEDNAYYSSSKPSDTVSLNIFPIFPKESSEKYIISSAGRYYPVST